MENHKIQMFDNVKIKTTPDTKRLGIANKYGQVYGETTPSSTHVEVIGTLTEDFALNIFLEDLDKDFWLTSDLIEFIDNGAGAEIIIGNKKCIKQKDGSWKEI